jgi:hypothetical protein
MLEREEDTGALNTPPQSVPLTSSTLWKWLVKRSNTNRKAIAVVFELPQSCWPINVRLEVTSKFAKEFLRAISVTSVEDCVIPKDAATLINDGLNRRGYADFDCEVLTPKGLGHLLHLYKESGARPWAQGDESIEIIIREPVPSSCIGRIVPMYQRNVTFKKKKEKGGKHRAGRYE